MPKVVLKRKDTFVKVIFWVRKKQTEVSALLEETTALVLIAWTMQLQDI